MIRRRRCSHSKADKDWDHAHHDTNGFVLYAYGQPLIVDLRYLQTSGV
jgi:hypothetical protein